MKSSSFFFIGKITSYRKCCCCSLGTACVSWASFQIVFAVFLLFSGAGIFFIAGGVLSLLVGIMLLLAAGTQNAFVAFVVFYVQTFTYGYILLQLIVLVIIFITQCVSGVAWEAQVTITPFSLFWNAKTTAALQWKISLFLYYLLFIIFYFFYFSAGYFVLRLMWSFYRVLQAGGTTYEYKTAEDLEDALLRSQTPMVIGQEYESTRLSTSGNIRSLLNRQQGI